MENRKALFPSTGKGKLSCCQPKSFSSCRTVCFCNSRFDFFKKIKIFGKTHKPVVCIPVDLLAGKYEDVLFQVLAYEGENPGQVLLRGTGLQMVPENQPKTE